MKKNVFTEGMDAWVECESFGVKAKFFNSYKCAQGISATIGGHRAIKSASLILKRIAPVTLLIS